MTKGELHNLSKRIDEISSILDICDDNHDADVIENLELELTYIIETLESSIEALKAS